MTFPVLVLTESDKVIIPNRTGEARESTTHYRDETKESHDSRGGENFIFRH